MLKGRKTYLGAAAFAILGVLLGLKLITQEQFNALASIAGAWTAYGLRSALN